MLPNELDRFSREFYASYYREDLRRLGALSIANDEDL